MLQQTGTRDIRLPIVNGHIQVNCFLVFGGKENPELQSVSCIVDTGAPLTVIPQRYWEPYRDRLPGIENPDESVNGIGGGKIPAKLSEAEILIMTPNEGAFLMTCRAKFAFDREQRLPQGGLVPRLMKRLAKFVFGQKTQSGYEIPVMLLGLGGGLLKDCALCIRTDRDEAHLLAWPCPGPGAIYG